MIIILYVKLSHFFRGSEKKREKTFPPSFLSEGEEKREAIYLRLVFTR